MKRPMTYRLTLAGLFLALLLPACATKDPYQPMDVQCDTAIHQANSRYEEAKTSLGEEPRGRIIANLITAARIDQQQSRFSRCLEKAKRALDLLEM
jgi:hypothetical protein